MPVRRQDYADAILPAASELSLAFCLPEDVLAELQDSSIQANALAQRERLAGLFPSLAAPTDGTQLPSLLRSFACVRSRAFKASDDCFAFVPFLDTANHANEPNADFRCTPEGSSNHGSSFAMPGVGIAGGNRLLLLPNGGH